MPDVITIVSLVMLASLACLGAWSDIRTRILPNWLVIVTFLSGLLAGLSTGGLETLPSHLLHCVAALAIGIALFAFKVWGAGDGKFYAAIAAWMPIDQFLSLVFSISIVGVLFTLGYFLRYRGKLLSKGNVSIPYGVAIGFGGVLAYSRGTLW